MEVLCNKLGRILNNDGSVTFLRDFEKVTEVSFFDIGKKVVLRNTAPQYVYRFSKKVVKIKAGETISGMDIIQLTSTPPIFVDNRSAVAIKEDHRVPWNIVNFVMDRINNELYE